MSPMQLVSHASHLIITLSSSLQMRGMSLGTRKGLLFPDLLIIPLFSQAFIECVWPVSSIVCACLRSMSKQELG